MLNFCRQLAGGIWNKTRKKNNKHGVNVITTMVILHDVLTAGAHSFMGSDQKNK